ncbi:MAG: VacJ family lipoprotein [Desulfuromonas sp.]|nr:VacJ family lipoprotein [Desulfuromonas sp.]
MKSQLLLAMALGFVLLTPSLPLAQDTPTTAVAPAADMAAGAYSDGLFDDLYADDEGVESHDPLVTLNRGTFWVNDKCYFYLLKPLARGFRIVPLPVRNGLRNIFYNLRSPIDTANALLQLKFKQAGTQLSRLLVNSTVGVLGFFDVAGNYYKWERKEEDFGQTLGFYGVGEGFYLVLPLLGPSTLRDGIALVPDGYADPIYWLADYPTTLVSKGVKAINTLSLDNDSYESIVEEQLDPYLFVRDAYLQHRRYNVEN